MVFNEAFVEQMRSALAADKARGREGLEAERIMYGHASGGRGRVNVDLLAVYSYALRLPLANDLA